MALPDGLLFDKIARVLQTDSGLVSGQVSPKARYAS